VPEQSSARSYHFHPQAGVELIEETERLRGEDAAISQAFEEETSRAIGMLLDHPESAPVIIERGGKKIRSKVLRRFRYSLVYAYLADEIFILAVAHQSRRPLYWIDRV
jgi:plasmid stabilization system protein ParE